MGDNQIKQNLGNKDANDISRSQADDEDQCYEIENMDDCNNEPCCEIFCCCC